jgi:hypothetical protein
MSRSLVFSIVVAVTAFASVQVNETLAQQATSASVASTEAVILTLKGRSGDQKALDLTLSELEKLPRHTITTSTPWHDGVQMFEGVLLSDLLKHSGLKGQQLKVTALNNYQIEIPFADADLYRPVLAFKRNGQLMNVRDKGPLFVIYPYDEKPGLKTELYFSRSAWQVRTILVD